MSSRAPLLSLLALAAVPAAAQAPVDGPGKDVFVRACAGCHEVTTATQRRMSETDWRAMVNRMVDMGAQATPEEIETIGTYLAAHYGLTSAKPAAR